MLATGYPWRQLDLKQREELLEWRKMRGYPCIPLRIGPILDIRDFSFRRLVWQVEGSR